MNDHIENHGKTRLTSVKLHKLSLDRVMMMKYPLAIILFIIVLGFLKGCSSTKMLSVWQSPEFQKVQLQRVLVVGLTASAVNRMVFEREFAYQLNKEGISTIESFKVLGDDTPNKAMIEKYVKDHNISFVLIAYQSGLDVTKDYIEPQLTTYVSNSYPITEMDRMHYYPTMDSFWSPGSFVTLKTGGYEEETVKAFLVASIYRANNGKLVWSGKSSIFDPDSVSEASYEVAKIMLKHIQ